MTFYVVEMMFEALKDWWNSRSGRNETPDPSHMQGTTARQKPKAPVTNEVDAPPQHDVLIRNKYVREETGTHESLKILDDSMIDSGEEAGIDPYNTGGFDRSRNWETRFRK